MKTVGVILRKWRADVKDTLLYGVRTDLITFLRRYNINVIAIPVEFESEDEFEKVKPVIDMCDGIVFPGGKYVRKVDCEMMKYVYEKDKPTLGICLGMQIMGSTFGDAKREKTPKRRSQ